MPDSLSPAEKEAKRVAWVEGPAYTNLGASECFNDAWLAARDYYEQRHIERMAPAIEAAADFEQRERVLRHVLQLTTEALESTTESLMMAIDLHAEEREAIRADIARAHAALADTESQDTEAQA